MLRTDLWVSAFVRRHNDLGEICVIVRRGDAIAGQIFIEVDHLNGHSSLLCPAPAASRRDNDADRIFVFKDGRVAEVGDYGTLVAQNGLFAQLVRSADEHS